MPRKKIARRKPKNQQVNTVAALQKMEKDFLQAPARLAAQLNKEINSTKQQESKLKKSLSQVNSQLQNSEKRIRASSPANTATAKKQLRIAKLAQKTNAKEKANLQKQLNAITKELQATAIKRAKFVAVQKHINQFEKDWIKQAKALQAKAKTQPKAKAKAKKAAMDNMIEQQQEAFEQTSDHMINNEVTAEVM